MNNIRVKHVGHKTRNDLTNIHNLKKIFPKLNL